MIPLISRKTCTSAVLIIRLTRPPIQTGIVVPSDSSTNRKFPLSDASFELAEVGSGSSPESKESITFDGTNSSDSPTDRSSLQFIWDDPNTEGATQDGAGEEFTIMFDRPGKYFVNLTVTDDDGRSSTASVLVEVKEKPSEGLFGMTTSTAVGAALGVIIVLLVVVLLLRGRESDSVPYETKEMSDTMWGESPPAVATTAEVPEPVAAAPEAASAGPPIPATGLPQGWTMEQWEHYGQKYLDGEM